MTDRQAWFCPTCQKHHAPHVETCPGGTGGYPVTPMRPSPQQPVFDFTPCPGCERGCLNTACPKRMQITCGGVTVQPDPNIILVN